MKPSSSKTDRKWTSASLRRRRSDYSHWKEVGAEMEQLRLDALVPREHLAVQLGITGSFLRDMELGRRYYAEYYVMKATRFILKSI